MTDGIKIVIFDPELILRVWNNPLLEYFSEEQRRITKDELKETQTRSYRNLRFIKHTNCLIIIGSIHTFFNDGLHNANDFSFVNSIATIQILIDQFNLDSSKCIIQNIEFGLNILPQTEVKNIVNWLKYHEKNEFYKDPGLQYSKRSQKYNTDGKANNYKVIKAYAKGIEKFNGITYAEPNTLRFEVGSKQAKYFNRLGICTLADLLKPEIYLTLATELAKEFDNILLLEKGFQGIDNKLDKFLNPDFWENCINGSRNQFAKQKQSYFNLLNNFPGNIHSEIKNLLKAKLDFFSEELKTGAISTGLTQRKKVQFPQYLSMEYAPIHSKCIVTGLPIHNQRPGTKYVGHKSIKWYYENKPETYEKQLKSLLTDKWLRLNFGKPIQAYFDEIYHQIRNRALDPKHNPRNNAKRAIKKILSYPALFDSMPFIRPEKMELAGMI